MPQNFVDSFYELCEKPMENIMSKFNHRPNFYCFCFMKKYKHLFSMKKIED